jgi:uncharacterized flavoprotein (TIGR03862 family)
VDSGVQKTAAVIGAGPAGLMAAEVLSAAGVAVTVYERMPTTGRKLLMAGRGGLNLTHSEPFEALVARYGEAATPLRPLLEAFPPAALIAWAESLGQPVFTGSSGRVFPRSLKASPLLRAWLARLEGQGVVIRTRREWLGWDADGALRLREAGGDEQTVRPDVTILALGGGSWPKLGSNGAWVALLDEAGVAIRPLRPANGGFLIDWSDIFRDRFAGAPLKSVALTFDGRTRVTALRAARSMRSQRPCATPSSATDRRVSISTCAQTWMSQHLPPGLSGRMPASPWPTTCARR